MSKRVLLLALAAAAAMTAAVASAVALAGGPRDDIPIYTAPTIPVYTAPTVQPVQPASQVEFYKATIIKPLPRSAAIKKIASHGFSLPSHCNWLCSVYSWVITDNIAAALIAKQRVVGKASVKNHAAGNIKLALRLNRRSRHKLARLHRRIKVKIRERVVDSATGYTKQYQRTVTLHP